MGAPRLMSLENSHWQVGILPYNGASIAYTRIWHDGSWVDLLRPTPVSAYNSVEDSASFVLIPWASRIANATFRFNGTTYSLRSQHTARYAMHGIVRDYPWRIETSKADRLGLTFQSADHADANFPFRFSARLEFLLEGNCFRIKTALKNEDSQPMPGGFGHHPFFQRNLDGTSDAVEVEIPCHRYFDLSHGVPNSASQPIPARLDFTQLRPLGRDGIDDCLVGKEDKPIRIVYPNAGRSILFHADSIFQIVVLYVPENSNFFAVEPLTLATDGFNLFDKKIPDSGVFVLQSGQEQSGTLALEIEK